MLFESGQPLGSGLALRARPDTGAEKETRNPCDEQRSHLLKRFFSIEASSDLVDLVDVCALCNVASVE